MGSREMGRHWSSEEEMASINLAGDRKGARGSIQSVSLLQKHAP
jgi:hypothetical protein